MYNVYLGKMLCPVAPEKIVCKFGNGNKTMTLMNGEEVNFLKEGKLGEVEFTLLLPNTRYPFAVYRSGFEPAVSFLRQIEKLKNEKKPFQFIIVRKFPGGKRIYNTNAKVSLEDYRVEEGAKNGFDVYVTIKLREYRDFGTRVGSVGTGNAGDMGSTGGGTSSALKQVRPSESSPAPKGQNKTYRVVKGDCMWLIAQKFYGNGNLYEKIYEANKSVLAGRSPRCLIFVGDELTIPPLDG